MEPDGTEREQRTEGLERRREVERWSIRRIKETQPGLNKTRLNPDSVSLNWFKT